MQIKLIALDLDGTLLNAKKEISVANREALISARQQGVKVVITTGRPLAAVENFLKELDLMHPDDYSITFNGGLVQTNDGGILDETGFGIEAVETIYQTTQKLGLPLDVIHGGDVYILPAPVETLYPTCNSLLNFVPTRLEDLPRDLEFNKAITAYEAEVLDGLIPEIPVELNDQFEIFKSREILLEWSPKGVHKAEGLAKLIGHLGIEQAQVMACGDEENDLSMIAWAGLGICMANGANAVKKVADVVTPMTNEEDAVAWAIRKYILGEE
ncbi:HAD family phosphatase [Streptococcus minor]|uniref:HAD family phosphatase n=1 Tax=Streptococcus minor TaxID=229549 RepID=A0A3P1VG74_9STRE|nr:Cof-type HAD-IIB family hydrolase [Streptococcus minor]RRD32525.1 HAD family phosphatase [Streptococcus minor]